ncbi:hypothetical protein EOI86_20580 [Hwanghaeella grinnelliae]|uniref:Uncharacterized protein n=1 Tax=Hwanghaeella grinnelliae TaxID=2500179 RepID=A0A3S2VLR8_9PROT|nr:hypothetical protein [Hwanghaeella grinnelliae]RVU35213.1 hypothetical protein EOI86_20580 [Hwanghaeella grinnelliae]
MRDNRADGILFRRVEPNGRIRRKRLTPNQQNEFEKLYRGSHLPAEFWENWFRYGLAADRDENEEEAAETALILARHKGEQDEIDVASRRLEDVRQRAKHEIPSDRQNSATVVSQNSNKPISTGLDAREGKDDGDTLGKSNSVVSRRWERARNRISAGEIRKKAVADGHLSLGDANALYRATKAPSFEVTVDATQLKVLPLGEVPKNGQVNAIVIGPNDYLVHGTVSLRIADGVATIQDEEYDFEWKYGIENLPRNVATVVGEAIAGDGTKYRMKFRGSPTVVDPIW